jgi:hypothetical protein
MGPGKGRAIPALDEVYAVEQLPPRQPLKPGEQKAVAQKGLSAWFAEISRGRRVPKSCKKPVSGSTE